MNECMNGAMPDKLMETSFSGMTDSQVRDCLTDRRTAKQCRQEIDLSWHIKISRLKLK